MVGRPIIRAATLTRLKTTWFATARRSGVDNGVEESFAEEAMRIRMQLDRRQAQQKWVFRPGESKWVNRWDLLGVMVLS